MLISLFGGDPEGKDGIVDSLSKLFGIKKKWYSSTFRG